MKLTWREQNHKQRGHWHFDWNRTESDVTWYRHRFPKEACDELANLVLVRHQDRGMNPRDQIYSNISVNGIKTVVHGYNIYTGREAPAQGEHTCIYDEEAIDRQEAIDNWKDSGMDPFRVWGTTLLAKRDEIVYETLQKYIKKYNWLGDKEDFEYKFWIQYPGQMTPCHMDHMYDFYTPERTRWDDAKVQRKIHCMITPWEPGHYMCWGNDTITHWEQGAGFAWNWGLPHWTANLGKNPRVSLVFSVKGDITDEELRNGMGETL